MATNTNDPSKSFSDASYAHAKELARELDRDRYRAIVPGRVMNDASFVGVYGHELSVRFGIDITIAREFLASGSLTSSMAKGKLGDIILQNSTK